VKLHSAQKVADYKAQGYWAVPTWQAALASNAQNRPAALAVADPLNRQAITEGAPQRLTWGELDANVDSIAAALYQDGSRCDDVIGVQLPNTVELPLVLLAVNRLGAIACPFPASYREHELVSLCQLAGVTTLVTCSAIAGRRPAARSAELPGQVPGLRSVLVFGENLAYPARQLPGPGQPSGQGQLPGPGQPSASYRRYVAALKPDVDDCTTICWTSGTESTPKAVPRCAADWHSMARANLDLVSADTVLHCPYPIVNMAGISGFIAWLYTGCASVLHHPFDLEVFLDQIEQEAVTVTRAAPTLLTRLLRDDAALRRRDLSSLKVVTSGSSALSGTMIRAWKERHGVDVCNFFGSNEGVALASTPDTVADPEQRATLFPRLGVPGLAWHSTAAAGVRTRLVDPVDGTEITEPGRMGELRTQGPGVFAGYFNPGAAADPFDSDGWLRTGDLFEIAVGDSRYYRYVDRLKDIVVRGGMNISSAEIESLVTGHPGIAEAAAVGFPDAEYGEILCVFVVPEPGELPVLADVVEYLRGLKIASFKLPARLEVVDQLPRNAAGKILKRELRDRLALNQPQITEPAADHTKLTTTPLSSA